MAVLPTYKGSFFCDLSRQDGLQLKVLYEKENGVYCNLYVSNRFEGYTDVVHGGMVFGILDVIIWYAIMMETKKVCMTRHIEMDFFKPVMCNTSYIAKAKLIKVKGKDFHTSAWVEDKNGECYAKVNAVFRETKDLSIIDFLDRMDFRYTSPEIKDYFLSLMEKKA